jgi:hypothetical protein
MVLKQNLLDLLQRKSMDVISIGIHNSYPSKSMLIMTIVAQTIPANFPLCFTTKNIYVIP